MKSTRIYFLPPQTGAILTNQANWSFLNLLLRGSIQIEYESFIPNDALSGQSDMQKRVQIECDYS